MAIPVGATSAQISKMREFRPEPTDDEQAAEAAKVALKRRKLLEPREETDQYVMRTFGSLRLAEDAANQLFPTWRVAHIVPAYVSEFTVVFERNSDALPTKQRAKLNGEAT